MRRLLVPILLVLAAFPAPASAVTVLFRDDFNGAAGSRPNQNVWRSLKCSLVAGSTCSDTRARLDGQGNLYLETVRTQGAFIGTFDYGSGWPPSGVRASWSVPVTVTARLLMPTDAGIWTGIWPMSTNRSRAQGVWELDMAEVRSSLPNRASAFHHYFVGSNHYQKGGHLDIGGAGQWHTYKMTVASDKTTYTVDGKPLLQGGGVSGRIGLLMHSLAGNAGTWQTNYGPAMSVPVARSKIDFIEVSR